MSEAHKTESNGHIFRHQVSIAVNHTIAFLFFFPLLKYLHLRNFAFLHSLWFSYEQHALKDTGIEYFINEIPI